MKDSSRSWWWWTRGALAVALAGLLVAIALPSAGRLVVDRSAVPAVRHVVWGVRECLPSIGLAVFSLACIFVGMWKCWDFEIVGWAILLVFILASGVG
jgi:hypothetical protein